MHEMKYQPLLDEDSSNVNHGSEHNLQLNNGEVEEPEQKRSGPLKVPKRIGLSTNRKWIKRRASLPRNLSVSVHTPESSRTASSTSTTPTIVHSPYTAVTYGSGTFSAPPVVSQPALRALRQHFSRQTSPGRNNIFTSFLQENVDVEDRLGSGLLRAQSTDGAIQQHHQETRVNSPDAKQSIMERRGSGNATSLLIQPHSQIPAIIQSFEVSPPTASSTTSGTFKTGSLAQKKPMQTKDHQYWFSQWFVDSDLEFQFVQRYYGSDMETLRVTLFVAIIISTLYLVVDFALIKPSYPSERDHASVRYIVDLIINVSILIFATVVYAVIHNLMNSEERKKKRTTHQICELLTALICNVVCVYSCIETAIWFDQQDRQFPTAPLIITFVTFTLFHVRSFFMFAIPILSLTSYVVTFFIRSRYSMSKTVYVRGTVYSLWILLFGSTSLYQQMRFLERYYRSHFLAEMSLQNQKKELHEEYLQTEQLLNNILPAHFLFFLEAEYSSARSKELKRVHYLKRTCVLLSDIEGFTNFSRTVSSRDLLHILNLQFSRFDQITQAHNVSKVKTVGDAYFALSICQKKTCEAHYVRDCVMVALEMIEAMSQLNKDYGWHFNIRIGVACGDAYACILGKSRITFDIFGLESVAYAGIMERTSKVNSVHVTEAVMKELQHVPNNFVFCPSDVYASCPHATDDSMPNITSYYVTCEFLGEEAALEESKTCATYRNFSSEAYSSHKMLEQVTEFLDFEDIPQYEEPQLNLEVNNWLMFKRFETGLMFIKSSFKEALHSYRAIFAFQSTFYILMIISTFAVNVLQVGYFPFSHVLSAVVLYLSALLQLIVIAVSYTKYGKGIRMVFLGAGISLLLALICPLAFQFENNMKQDVTALCVVWGIIVVVGVMPLMPFVLRLILSSATLLLFLSTDQLITRFFNKNDKFSFQMNDVVFGVFCVVCMNFTSYFMDQSMIEAWIMKKNLASQCKLSKIENMRNDRLVRCVLPQSVADTLKQDPERIWDYIPDGCAAFIDVVGFDNECFNYHNVGHALSLLNNLFTEFDSLCEELDCDKIKSINNLFLVVTGLRRPATNDEHEGRYRSAVKMANLLVRMRKVSRKILNEHAQYLKKPECIGIKIGAAQGPIISGVVGDDKFLYDCFGTTINEASRMTTTGLVNQIHISPNLKSTLSEGGTSQFTIREREGAIMAKGIGEMHTFFLDENGKPPPSPC